MIDVTPDDCTPAEVSTPDLWSAIEWLGTYEGDSEDENPQALANVMAMLKREALRRDATQAARKALRKAGYQRPSAAAIRKVAQRIIEDTNNSTTDERTAR